MPYETGAVRLLLGRACRLAGDEEAAIRSFEAAEAIFGQLGATLALRTVRSLRQRETDTFPR